VPPPRAAVLLAAGEGRRLGGDKPLARLRGRPLAWYPLSVLHLLGAAEFAIVTRRGLAAELRRLAESIAGPASVLVVVNEEPWRENGYSLLLGLEALAAEALVSMSDHVYSPLLAARVADTAPRWSLYRVGCDREPCCVDLDEATKVLEAGGRVAAQSKSLRRWSCVDTGVHAAAPALLLRDAASLLSRRENGVIRLNALVSLLGAMGAASAAPAHGLPWLEVDTPEDLEAAEKGGNRWVVDHVLAWLHA